MKAIHSLFYVKINYVLTPFRRNLDLSKIDGGPLTHLNLHSSINYSGNLILICPPNYTRELFYANTCYWRIFIHINIYHLLSMKKNTLLLTITMSVLATTACNSGKEGGSQTASSFSDSNPFAKQSTLPYHTFNFSKLHNEDFAPAFNQGMKEQLEEVSKIADNTEAPTFDNTLVALEKSGQLLNRARSVFSLLTGANTNDTLQKLDEEYAPKFAAQNDAIYLNDKLFKRVEAIYNQRQELKLDAESLRLTQYYYQCFIIAGAKLPAADKEQLKKMNAQEASLSSKFNNQLLAASKAGTVVIDNPSDLAGMPEADIAAAKDSKHDSKWELPLQNTTQQPYLQFLKSKDVRKKIFEASWTRAERSDSNDTRKTISSLAQLRAQKAKLLGFPNYAAWKLQDQMAKTPQAVLNFLHRLIPPTVAKGKTEAADIQRLMKSQGDTSALEAWDWNYYSEQVRKAKYDLD